MRLVWFQSVFMSQLDGCCYHMMFNTEECEIYGGSIWRAGGEGEGEEQLRAISLWQTPMQVMWVGARWPGHPFLLLSMWGGTRLWGGACAAAPHAARRSPRSKDCTLLGVCVHMQFNAWNIWTVVRRRVIKTALARLSWSRYRTIPLFFFLLKRDSPAQTDKTAVWGWSHRVIQEVFSPQRSDLAARKRWTSRPFVFPVRVAMLPVCFFEVRSCGGWREKSELITPPH